MSQKKIENFVKNSLFQQTPKWDKKRDPWLSTSITLSAYLGETIQ
jgi:hypothetical protein